MKLKHACVDAGQYGFNVTAEEYRSEGTRLIRTSDLSDGGLATNGIYVEGPVDERYLLHPGDLLLSRSGTVGRAFEVHEDAAGFTYAGFLVRFRPKPESFPRYLFYLTQSKGFQDQVAAGAIASTIQNFNADRYANVDIPELTLDEQRRIAHFLDDQVSRIDAIVGLRSAQLVALNELFRSKIQHRLWADRNSVPLRRIAGSITSGPRGWGDLITDEGTPFLRIANLPTLGPYIKVDDLIRVAVPAGAEARRAVVRSGDVLMSITASLGNVAFVGDDFDGSAFSQHVARIRPHASMSSEWLAWALQSATVLDDLRTKSYGGTKIGLGLEDVREVAVPDADAREQRRAAADLRSAWSDHVRVSRSLRSSIAALGEYKLSLITAAVTGELDVATASNRSVPA